MLSRFTDKPRVRMTMDPNKPVTEREERNVSLTCGVDSGNPAILDAVRWYLDGELLKELPDCPNNFSYSTPMPRREVGDGSDLCDIDPSKLLLESVGRSFQGNYTCQGRNEAGWGPQSGPVELHVYCKLIYINYPYLFIQSEVYLLIIKCR